MQEALRWDEQLSVPGGSVTIHCALLPEGHSAEGLAGTPAWAKQQLVGIHARKAIEKMRPEPGDEFIFTFPDGACVKMPR